ncbi:MAG: RHS repeat-associated core domain-containing protein, partial [Thermoanaerobaculum sp.]
MRQLTMAGCRLTCEEDSTDERVAWADSTEQGIHYTLRGLGNEVLREVSYSYNPSASRWQVVWEKDSIWAGKRLLASVSRTEGIQHYHLDHLGSPRVVTNRCGQRVKLLDHNPWGLDRFSSTQDPERHRFTAHQRDVGSPTRSWDDLDYMHARYYTGYLARMLSPDPVRGDVFSPQSFNLFAYVGGNPINFVDPWGLAASGKQ